MQILSLRMVFFHAFCFCFFQVLLSLQLRSGKVQCGSAPDSHAETSTVWRHRSGRTAEKNKMMVVVLYTKCYDCNILITVHSLVCLYSLSFTGNNLIVLYCIYTSDAWVRYTARSDTEFLSCNLCNSGTCVSTDLELEARRSTDLYDWHTPDVANFLRETCSVLYCKVSMNY